MIFLDANFFLRFWTDSDAPADIARQEIAAGLFARIEVDASQATTSEAVLAEVAFVLTSKRQYGLPVNVAASLLVEAIRMPGLKWPPGRKDLFLRALELWTARPKLDFVDALTAAMVEGSGDLLATFDSDFEEMEGIEFWRPDNGHRADPIPSETT